jgi:serine/threonine protein kinase
MEDVRQLCSMLIGLHYGRRRALGIEPIVPDEREIRLIRELRSGVRSSIHEGEDEDGNRYAVKRFLHDIHFTSGEVEILRKVDHPNCIKLLWLTRTRGPVDDAMYLNVVYELFPTNLFIYMTAKKGLPLSEVRSFAYQLFKALRYLHAEEIIHGDVCPENILVDPDTGRLQLCDFGQARMEDDPVDIGVWTHSLRYLPPELFWCFQDFKYAADNWAAGVVLAEMMCGERLFKAETRSGMQREIESLLGEPSSVDLLEMNLGLKTNNEVNPRSLRFPSPAKERILSVGPTVHLFNLLMSVLKYSPGRRLTAAQVLTSEFFDVIRNK